MRTDTDCALYTQESDFIIFARLVWVFCVPADTTVVSITLHFLSDILKVSPCLFLPAFDSNWVRAGLGAIKQMD